MKAIVSWKKALCLLLAVLTVCGSFVACGGGDDEETTTAAKKENTTEAVTKDPSEVHDLPSDLDFNKTEITMLVANQKAQENEFHLEEDGPSSALLLNAVYERNAAVERELNIDLVTVTSDYPANQHQTDFMAGTTEFPIIADETTNRGSLIIQGYFYNLNELDYLNLDKKYWSQGFGEVVSFGTENKQYLATGAIAMSLYRLMYATIYNKKLLENYQIEDPYDTVMSGGWTLDKQYEILAGKFEEKDNDPGATEGDFYGLIAGTWTSMDPYLVSSNLNLIKKNVDTGKWEYDNSSAELLVEICAAVQKLTTNESTYLYDTVATDQPGSTDILTKFAEKEGIMATMIFLALEKCVGDIDFEYGIAPIPKYSVNQREYYTYVQDQVTSIGVNATVSKDSRLLEQVGATLEALGYYSYIYISDAYYEQTLSLRLLNDPKTADIIDILYKSVAMDFAGAMSSTFTFKLRDQLRSVFSSDKSVRTLINRKKSSINASLREINNKIDSLP